MSALPLFKRKTGVPHSRFCPFLPFFAPSRGEDKPFSPRVYIICQNWSLHLLPLLPVFYFSLGSAKKCFYSFCLSWHSTFFYHCQHLSGKALHGRARWSVFARPLYELFSFAFPAFGSSRKSAHAAFHFFAVPSLWSALFLFPFPLLCQIAAKKACSLMQWLTAPFFSPLLFPHKTTARLFLYILSSTCICASERKTDAPPALRFPARFRKTIDADFL